jgi:hypothetical protein
MNHWFTERSGPLIDICISSFKWTKSRWIAFEAGQSFAVVLGRRNGGDCAEPRSNCPPWHLETTIWRIAFQLNLASQYCTLNLWNFWLHSQNAHGGKNSNFKLSGRTPRRLNAVTAGHEMSPKFEWFLFLPRSEDPRLNGPLFSF